MLRRKLILTTIALLFSTLACRAATRLIIPDTPTPPPTPVPPTLTPFPPATFTPTPIPEASCPVLTADILNTAVNFDFDADEDADDEIYLISYFVNGDEISDPFKESVPNQYKDEQEDSAAHEEIWNYFTRLIPLEARDFLTAFSIVTDGNGNVLAAVAQSASDAEDWALEVDILDATNKYVLTVTLLHEFGHLLTLNSSQVPPSEAVFDAPEDDDVYQRELAACPNYFPGEGCSNQDSYVNRFFDRFWFDLYAEWQEIDSEEDEDRYYDLLDDFYYTYEDQFLTEYSVTSPAEDIAESFAFFILAPKPEPSSIADEKILFFYEFPELIELRGQILNQLCMEFPQ
ncbi:MAG: hypothetical protein QY306_00310 [Anaerolineales bacterium]|nr:MAG: hypothetical protein QY306_00310 [Anaerolineales bacterium]